MTSISHGVKGNRVFCSKATMSIHEIGFAHFAHLPATDEVYLAVQGGGLNGSGKRLRLTGETLIET